MNTEDLHVALQQSFSPDANLRNPAEEVIKGLKNIDGATAMLLQITAEKQVQFEVRQAAAIQLKNICRNCWVETKSYLGITIEPRDGSEKVLLKEADKLQVKNYILEVLLAEPEKSVQDLLAETIFHIVKSDFPHQWPTLIPIILQTVQQSDLATQGLRVHNALVALRKICKRFEYKNKKERGPLDQIADQFFPLLLPLAQRLNDPNEHSLEAAMTLKQILKIFYASTEQLLPQSIGGIATLLHPEVMQPWFEVFEKALSKKLPEDETGLPPLKQPKSEEAREKWPWWKVKKWASKIIKKMFLRHGLPASVEKEVKIFANYFSKQVAPQFLGPICETLNLRADGHFCTNVVMHNCLGFIEISIELSSTYKVLKPHMDFMLYRVCFPTICMSERDIYLFEHEPHEYMQREYNFLNEFLDPRSTATRVVGNLVKYRGQDTINGLLVFFNDILQKYANGSQNHVEKDGCLQMIGCLSKILFNTKKYETEAEPMIVTHVFPEFRSSIPFLRSRACCIVQEFDHVKWSDSNNLNTMIHMVLQSLSDPSLIVQFEASKALRSVLEVEGAETILLPMLPKILQEFSRIMNDIGNDEVVSALQKIIMKFGDKIGPHAVVLIDQLSNAFSSFYSEGIDDDEAHMAASQCLECMSTVLKGVCDYPEIHRQLEPKLLPMVKELLGNEDNVEYMEFVLELLTCMTFFQEDLSPELWETFSLMYNACNDWAYDFLLSMLPVFENFIGRGTHHFIHGVGMTPSGPIKHIDMIFSLVHKISNDERSNENDVRLALQLYMIILHNCRGQVDNYLPAINDGVLSRLQQIQADQAPLTRKVIFQIIGSAFHYNPTMELNELETRGVTQQVFNLWLNDTENLESWLSKKIVVLGLSSILLIPTSSIPQSLLAGFQHIISCATIVMEKMQDESDYVPQEENEGNGKKNGNEDDLQGFNENEDVQNLVDDLYLNPFEGKDDFARFLFGDEWDELDDEDYISPLDDIDTLSFYVDVCKNFFEKEPAIANSLPAPTVASFQKLLAIAEEEKNGRNGI